MTESLSVDCSSCEVNCRKGDSKKGRLASNACMMHPLEQLEGLSSGRQGVFRKRTQCLDCSVKGLAISLGHVGTVHQITRLTNVV